MRRANPKPSALSLWAVEPEAAQITWGHIDAGPVVVMANGKRHSIDHPGGPGAIEVDQLTPDTDVRFEVTGPGVNTTLRARTLTKPAGEELYRIATISDLHVGTDVFGFWHTMREDPPAAEVPSVRCARSAIAAAVDWGAQLIVIKGDAVHYRTPEHYEMLGRLVDEFSDVEMVLLPGNHDVNRKTQMSLPKTVGQRELEFETTPRARELPGLYLVTTDTAVDNRGIGTIERTGQQVLELASQRPKDTGLMLACHHQFQKYKVATYWPPGIEGESANEFLKALSDEAPGSFVTSGHTHRNRAYQRFELQLSEVSSTSDYPGSWAGYILHESGMTQTVRKIATPTAMEWLEYTKAAIGGFWQYWSPGSLSDRCFTHQWR